MLLWSYFTAVATDPGRVPPGWHPFSDEEVCPAVPCKSCASLVQLVSHALKRAFTSCLPTLGSHASASPSLYNHAMLWCNSCGPTACIDCQPNAVLQEAAYELERLNYASYQPVNKSVRPRFCKKCQVRSCIVQSPISTQ